MTLESIRNDRYPRHKIIREIADEFNSWEYGVLELIDLRNWNLNNLVLEKPDRYVRGEMHYESNIRNPKAYFELFITSKGNLALDWYPYNPNFPGLAKEKWDWTHWDNKWPVGGTHLPFNRVFMIRGFEMLKRSKAAKSGASCHDHLNRLAEVFRSERDRRPSLSRSSVSKNMAGV